MGIDGARPSESNNSRASVGIESFCGIIRPKGSVVDYIRSAYSLTNSAESEF